MQNEKDYTLLLAVPCGMSHMDITDQTKNLTVGFIEYLRSKLAAGIVNVSQPGTNQVSEEVLVRLTKWHRSREMYSPMQQNTRNNKTRALRTESSSGVQVDLSVFLHLTKTFCRKHLCFIVPCVSSYRYVSLDLF